MNTKKQIDAFTAHELNHLQLKLFVITFFMVLAIVYSGPLYSQNIPEAPFYVSASPTAVCPSSPYANLKAVSQGNIIRWYTVATGGTAIGTTPSGGTLTVNVTQPTTYYAESFTPAHIASMFRTAVAVGVNTAPVITYTPADVNINNTPGQCGAIINYPSASATGTPTPKIIYSESSGSVFDGGTTTVFISAVNVCATTFVSFDVTVNDMEAPTLIAPPAISIIAPQGATAIQRPFLGLATTSDNCGILTTYNDAPAILPIGKTTVTWTTIDYNNNVTHGTQVINARLSNNPVDPVDIALPATPMAERIIKIPGGNNYTSKPARTELQTNAAPLQASVFPNPFTNDLSINLNSSNSRKVEVSIYDPFGKQVVNTQQVEPNIPFTIKNHLSPGIYFVRVTQDENTQVMKVIKN